MTAKGFEFPRQPVEGEYYIKDADIIYQFKNGQWNRQSAQEPVAAIASDVAFVPFGSISSTNVQSAIQELVSEAVSGGETNTASNLGTGSGLFSTKSGVDLRFKSLVAGSNVTLSSDANSITINATSPAGAASTATVNDWTATQKPANGSLSFATNVSWDATAIQVARLSLTGNATMDVPSNIIPNASYVLVVKQDAVGGWSLAWSSAFKFAGGILPVIVTSASAVSVFTFFAEDANTLYCVGTSIDVK